MMPRPHFRMPLWAALAIAAGAYVVRSAMRGLDFHPDLPSDAIVLVILLTLVGLVWWLRADDARRDAEQAETPSDPTDPES